MYVMMRCYFMFWSGLVWFVHVLHITKYISIFSGDLLFIFPFGPTFN